MNERTKFTNVLEFMMLCVDLSRAASEKTALSKFMKKEFVYEGTECSVEGVH